MQDKINIRMCMGSSCYSRGNFEFVEVVHRYINKHELADMVDFRGQLCTRNCNEGPVIEIEGRIFPVVNEVMTEKLLDEQVLAKVPKQSMTKISGNTHEGV